MISHITYLFSASRQSQFMRIFCQNSSISLASLCEPLLWEALHEQLTGSNRWTNRQITHWKRYSQVLIKSYKLSRIIWKLSFSRRKNIRFSIRLDSVFGAELLTFFSIGCSLQSFKMSEKGIENSNNRMRFLVLTKKSSSRSGSYREKFSRRDLPLLPTSHNKDAHKFL